MTLGLNRKSTRFIHQMNFKLNESLVPLFLLSAEKLVSPIGYLERLGN